MIWLRTRLSILLESYCNTLLDIIRLLNKVTFNSPRVLLQLPPKSPGEIW
ncbi:hypothetical protein BD01_0809 [Thermococcus nautili]|uniref:Uncharacterized protein n=1 Tax=Thermococcus nautili TaxID=195522 RepID=W8P117_9EURY|nr:hypothetical protein BD01_0809 [Thermococcus nautili]